MNLTILLPLLVCVAGLLLYVLASNPKLQEIGRAMLWCGLLAVMRVL
jgi:hypothetical protein